MTKQADDGDLTIAELRDHPAVVDLYITFAVSAAQANR